MLCACAGVVIQPDWGTLFDWAFSSCMPLCADCSSNPVWLSNPTSLSIFLLCACARWLCIQSIKSYLTEHFLVVCLCMLIVHPVCQIPPHWAFSCCVPVHAGWNSNPVCQIPPNWAFLCCVPLCVSWSSNPVWLWNPTSLSIFLLCAYMCWLE